MKYLLFCVLLAFSTIGCYYDRRDILIENTPCDSTIITYSGKVLPILSSVCVSCHSGSAPASGIKLDQYGSVRGVALGGLLLGVINHDPAYPAMPKNGGKLSDCNINIITKWIAAGAPNN